MWVKKKNEKWLATVVLGGFALPHIWVRTLAVTALSLVATTLYEKVPQLHYSITMAPFTLIGLPLGIFLGFRNNAAYDRFWTAKLDNLGRYLRAEHGNDELTRTRPRR